MPHIDIGKAFANPEENQNAAPPQPDNNPTQLPGNSPSEIRKTSLWPIYQLGRADWANILFVVVALAGGLFCAFYFYNGAETLRSAAVSPRELLYSRPIEPVSDTMIRAKPFADFRQGDLDDDSGPAPGEVPFGRNVAPVQLNSLATSSPALASNNVNPAAGALGSPLAPGLGGNPQPGGDPLPGGVGPSIPGVDALTQALNRGAANLQRATQMIKNAPHTVVVLKDRLTKVPQRTRSMVDAIERRTQSGLSGAVTRAGSIASAGNASAGRGVRAVQNQIRNGLGPASSLSRSSLDSLARNSVVTSSRAGFGTLGRASVVSSGRAGLGGVTRAGMSGLERSGLERNGGLGGLSRGAGFSGLGDALSRGGGAGEHHGGLGRGGGGRER